MFNQQSDDIGDLGAFDHGAMIASAINRLAKPYSYLRIKPRVVAHAIDIAMAAEKLFDLADAMQCRSAVADNLSPLSRAMFCASATGDSGAPDRGATYDWASLERAGSFFHECNSTQEADKARNSISAMAWKRYGRGAINTKCSNKGVFVSFAQNRPTPITTTTTGDDQ